MPPGGVVRWTFTDTATSESYEFEVNPNSGGSPNYAKNIEYQSTVGPGGNTLIFEGRDQPVTLEWSGMLLSADQHTTFVDWFYKRHQIQVTDDLGVTYTVYITGYEPKREPSVSHQHRRSYTMRATLLSW